METPDEIREFDERQTEIRHQAELTHRELSPFLSSPSQR